MWVNGVLRSSTNKPHAKVPTPARLHAENQFVAQSKGSVVSLRISPPSCSWCRRMPLTPLDLQRPFAAVAPGQSTSWKRVLRQRWLHGLGGVQTVICAALYRIDVYHPSSPRLNGRYMSQPDHSATAKSLREALDVPNHFSNVSQTDPVFKCFRRCGHVGRAACTVIAGLWAIETADDRFGLNALRMAVPLK